MLFDLYPSVELVTQHSFLFGINNYADPKSSLFSIMEKVENKI